MKKLLILSILCTLNSTFSPIWGQGGRDSLRYTQETGTLEKQRFIDRYDYVFMTKEPTKWMLKGYGTNITSRDFNSWRSLITTPYGAIEHKLSPSISVQLEGKFEDQPYVGVFAPDNESYYGGSIQSKNIALILTGEVRWYYDMARRIKEERSANNFSGNYWAVRYGRWLTNRNFEINQSWGLPIENGQYRTENFYNVNRSQLSLTYGLQRRFFRFGLIDMSVNLNYRGRNLVRQQIEFPNGDTRVIPNQRPDLEALKVSYQTENQEGLWFIDTKLQFGMALADFKKRNKTPLCDVLQCYENQSQMWKIGWPGLSLGLRTQNLAGFIGYEQKLLHSPFSLNGYAVYRLNNQVNKNAFLSDINTNMLLRGESSSFLFNYDVSLQARYYFLMQRRIKQGKSGNHLSGFYAGTNARVGGSNYIFKATFPNQNVHSEVAKSGFLGVAPMIGFQQKLFKHGVIDVGYTFYRSTGRTHDLRNQLFVSDFTIRTGFAF